MKCDELKPIHVPAEMCGEHTLAEAFDYYDRKPVDDAIAELKQKLHDAEMRADLAECAETERKIDYDKLKAENRRLKRVLWLARAERAKEHIWHDVNTDGSPKDDYKGHDWVLVQLSELVGIELIPRIAEYRRNLKRWVFIDEDYDTENTRSFCYLREQCKVIGWRDIDFAYYGKKLFVQQEINKIVERKCLKKAEEYK